MKRIRLWWGVLLFAVSECHPQLVWAAETPEVRSGHGQAGFRRKPIPFFA